jgi:hypothetical protein
MPKSEAGIEIIFYKLQLASANCCPNPQINLGFSPKTKLRLGAKAPINIAQSLSVG